MTYPTHTVTARQERDASFRWNVMVFMGVNTPDSERDLTKEAEENVRHMEPDPSAKPSADPKDHRLNVLVQRHTRDVAIRQQIGKPDKTRHLRITPRDATNGTALLDFLEWACDAAEHRAQDRTLLVLWGHSYDFAIARAETPTGIDGLDFAELGGILREFTERHKNKFDIVAFDACSVSSIEMAYELRDVADYLLSSQIGIPIPGWPYKRIFDRIRIPAGKPMGASELGSYIVRRYCEHYRATNKTVTLTLLDLQHAEEVFDQVNALARRLAILLDDAPERIAALMSRSRTIEGEPFIDVADFCLNVFREAGDRSLEHAALRLGDKLLSAAPAEEGKSLDGVGRPFVTEHGRNACETARLHGVSLYAPHVAPQHDIEDGREAYNAFAFFHDKNFWPEFARDPRLV